MEIQDLISIISSGVIVPVIGSDFCRVKASVARIDPRNKFRDSISFLKNAVAQNEEEVELALNQYLAIRMADKFGFASLKDEELSLNNVFLRSEFTEDTKYKMLYDEYQQLGPEKQLDEYIKLASIKDFRFYINTGPDIFLLDAFAKFGNRQPQFIAVHLLESNNNNREFKEPSIFEPVIFNIFGSINQTPYNDCAITDENYIELIIKLYEESKTQNSVFNKLFDILKQNNLLIIGASFPDWLTRFLIRLISAKRYTQSNQKLISDAGTLSKIEFANFLKQYNGRIITLNNEPFTSSKTFVDTLYNMMPGEDTANSARYKEKVFISFISEDRNIAELINKVFTEKGVPVFFDGREIGSGTNFENVIKPAIQNCDYFLPVITGHSTNDKVTRYVYKEWMLANFRKMSENAAGTSTFIKPYVFGTDNINEDFYKTYFEGIAREAITDTSEEALRKFAENFIARNKLTPVTT